MEGKGYQENASAKPGQRLEDPETYFADNDKASTQGQWNQGTSASHSASTQGQWCQDTSASHSASTQGGQWCQDTSASHSASTQGQWNQGTSASHSASTQGQWNQGTSASHSGLQLFQKHSLINEGITGYKFKGTFSFLVFFESLATNEDNQIREEFFKILKNSSGSYRSYYFETPMMKNIQKQKFEFVLIDAPQLSTRNQNPQAFMEHFQNNRVSVTFPSLGGDAVMVSPAPLEKHYKHYNDLASFMRYDEPSQGNFFWSLVAKTALKINKNKEPYKWMSTAGQGVAWLHLRFDSKPKYYNYEPYQKDSSGWFSGW